jgi:DNA-binding NtrC family response regulator
VDVIGQNCAIVCCEDRPQGKRAFIAEDDLLISLELETLLESMGCVVAGACQDIASSLQVIGSSTFDFAIINIRLADGDSRPLIAALAERRIPYAICTGYRTSELTAEFGAETPILEKPFALGDVESVVGNLLRGRQG